MREKILNWLASIQVRLIATYVLVTGISFVFLFILLLKPLEVMIFSREEDHLLAVATTLATTIRSPVESSEEAFLLDQKWTQQRRCKYLLQQLPHLRVRILNAQGDVLTDSRYAELDWSAWEAKRQTLANLRSREEVRNATDGQMRVRLQQDEGHTVGKYFMYAAVPVWRTDPNTRERRLAFIVYLNQPLDVVRSSINAQKHLLLLLMVVSLTLTVFVSVMISSHLSARLRAATHVARSFAAGRMQRRMPERGRDEVGQLGRAFNQMADALQRQERIRTELLADLSHELRTPLTAIAGCADTLADEPMQHDATARERFLHIILRESERMQRLVSDILELARLRAGAITIPLKPVDLQPIIADAVEVARLQTRPQQSEIIWLPQTEQRTNVLQVMGHEDRLAQAVQNLLDNAIHHTPAGKCIRVEVMVEAQWVTVFVCDEGEGIAPDDLPWVFDRFYRSGKDTTTCGTGLGLAIVREIMQLHGGAVSVESTVGCGTTFSLHLRRVQAEVPSELMRS
jgi:signal transduction histidine kinase